MFIDSHTHSPSFEADISVVNFCPADTSIELHQQFSCGIHPWFIDEIKTKSWLRTIEKLCTQKQIVAIGECGLDKNKDNLSLQKEIFKAQIKLSEQYMLPCIVHSVKTHHLLLELRKNGHSKQPWLVHGYHGSIEMAQQFASQNIFISFGENLIKYPEKFKKLLNHVDLNFVLLETDDCNVSIKKIYGQASRLLNIKMDVLENIIEVNFKRVFG